MSKIYTDRTKELFAGLIERPPLTDQLLQRPPFRFLHDIVKVTIQNTGFLMVCFGKQIYEKVFLSYQVRSFPLIIVKE